MNEDKISLKEQLKKQQQPATASSVQVNDPRVVGFSRIYFFQRLDDGFIFPLDSELQAHHMLRRKDFKQKYKYIGWSSGKHFAQLQNQPATSIKYIDGADISDESKAVIKAKSTIINEVIEKEFEEALDNPDKTPPRDFRSRDINGNLSDSQMAGWLKMMR